MTRRSSLSSLIFAAVVGAAASLGLDLSGHVAKANVVSLNTGETGSLPYTIGFIHTASTSPMGPSPTFNATLASVPVTSPPSAWLANGPNSNWIGPNSSGTGAGTVLAANATWYNAGFTPANSAPFGQFYYTTTFTLSGGPPYTFTGGLWTSDNQAVDIYLNGHDLGMSNTGDYTAFSSFSIPSSDFVTGLNTLSFVVFNEQDSPVHASPTGLRVEGTVTGVPEPSVLALIASGLPALGLMWNRRRRRQA